MSALRILLADDHEVVRRGARALLEAKPGWTVCGEAATGREAIAKTAELCPDLVLIDITMPDLDGLDAIPEILRVHRGVKIAVLTMHDSGEVATKALAAGASAVVLKSDAGRDLVAAVEAIERNQPFLSPAVTRVVLGQLVKTPPAASVSELTPRELEIVKLLAAGRSNKDVAAALGISVKTVDAHRANIMRRLHLRSYSELIRFAIRQRIIEL